jgi:zinc protease
MHPNLSWTRKVLSNGTRVLLFPQPTANMVQLSIVVEYGSNHDSDEKAGLAHFVEHMLAGGSTKRIQTSRLIEHLGGFGDFYTDNEYTMSQVNVLPDKLGDASQILHNLLFDEVLEEEKFELERKIILHELADTEDNPCAKVDELLLNCLFKSHPVKNPVGGFRKTVKQLTLSDVREGLQRYYVPEKMVIIFTGNFSQENIEYTLQNFIRKSTQKTFPNNNITEEKGSPEQVVREKEGISQTYLSLGVKTVQSKHPDAVALNVVDTLLGQGASSRLFIELREKRALTYDIHSSHDYGVDFGYFSIDCSVKEKNLGKTRDLILQELEKLRTQKVSVEELEKAKNIILGDVYRIIDNPQSCADALAFMEVQFHSETALMERIEEVKATTADDIMKAANTYLKKESFSTAILKPKQ